MHVLVGSDRWLCRKDLSLSTSSHADFGPARSDDRVDCTT